MGGYLSSIMDIGELLLKYGAEVSRVEDTMGRLCKAYGFVRADVLSGQMYLLLLPVLLLP